MHVVTPQERATPATVGLLALAGTLGAVAASRRWGEVGGLVALVVVVAAVAAVIDARSGRIPDTLVVSALVPTLVVVGAAMTGTSGAGALGAAVLGAVTFAGPIFVVHLVSPQAIGFGDVKLAAALGAALGLIDPRLGLPALCVAAGSTAAVGLARRRSALPFAPGLVIGTIAALVIAGQLGEEAVRWR